MAAKIQGPWPIVHKDVLARLSIDCESFRGELWTQLCRVRDIQGQLVQGVNQLFNAVDRKLIQNDRRIETEQGRINGVYTSNRELIGDREESERKHPNPGKITAVGRILEGINKAIEGEVNRGINSVLQNPDAMMREETKFDATLPRENLQARNLGKLTSMCRFG